MFTVSRLVCAFRNRFQLLTHFKTAPLKRVACMCADVWCVPRMLLAVSPALLLACVTSLLFWPLLQAHILIYRGWWSLCLYKFNNALVACSKIITGSMIHECLREVKLRVLCLRYKQGKNTQTKQNKTKQNKQTNQLLLHHQQQQQQHQQNHTFGSVANKSYDPNLIKAADRFRNQSIVRRKTETFCGSLTISLRFIGSFQICVRPDR